MVRWICAIVNFLLFAVTFIYAAVDPDVGPAGRREELTFYLLLALLFASVAAGLLTEKRWLVVVTSLPLLLTGILLALFVLAGGWIRGPLNATAVIFFIILGLGVAFLEIAALRVARKFQRPITVGAVPPPS